jgi:hypothetical protein
LNVETITQQIGAFVRDNGGNAWDALNVALARLDLATARAESAEAEVAKWREMHADRAHDLQHEYARAEALEVEVERLREALAEIASGGCVDPARTAAEALGR